MGVHPKAREAFAKVETATLGEGETWSKRNPDGTWSKCEEPQPLFVKRPVYVPHEKEKRVNLECFVNEAGEIKWASKIAEGFDDKRKTLKLERWLALSDAAKAPFFERAMRNMPEGSHKDYAEYGAYYLYARGLHEPYCILEYRAMKDRLKDRKRKR